MSTSDPTTRDGRGDFAGTPSARISPTAHYTGYVWYRNGLSHPALATREGRVLYHGLRPFNLVSRRLRGPTLEGFLLARHRAIDAALEAAIAAGRISQIVEIAAGLSPRGWDFARRHGDRITYIEADLPHMADKKRSLLENAGLSTAGHRVVALDALADDGPASLRALAGTLDQQCGLAIVTEGLLNYFPRDAVTGMWRRFAGALASFSGGLYLSDLHLSAHNDSLAARGFAQLLSTFVRGRVHLHFASEGEAVGELMRAGFDEARLIAPEPQRTRDAGLDRTGAAAVRVIQAITTARGSAGAQSARPTGKPP